MQLLEREGFDGMAMEEAEAQFYRRKNLQQGSRSIHMGSHNEEKPNASKNCGIADRKNLEDTRKSTEREADDKWTEWPLGGDGRPHMLGSQGHLRRYDFYLLSNSEKYIFALRNIRGMAKV